MNMNEKPTIVVRDVPNEVYWGMKQLKAKYQVDTWIDLFKKILEKENIKGGP